MPDTNKTSKDACQSLMRIAYELEGLAESFENIGNHALAGRLSVISNSIEFNINVIEINEKKNVDRMVENAERQSNLVYETAMGMVRVTGKS